MNLKTLAKSLGLSETTVSRALNGYPEVSEKTRQRVLAVARASGYKPNPSARNLAIGRTNVIGIVYSLQPADFGDPLFLHTVAGMTEALAKQDMDLVIAPVASEQKLHAYEQLVRGHRVDGLIVGRTRVRDERIAYLATTDMPFVAHGRTESETPYAWFDYDNEAGIRQAVEMLVSLGHQRIALISAPLEMNFAQQRRASFLQALRDAGLAVDPRHLEAGAIDRRGGYEAMTAFLASSTRPSAVIVDNHLSGVGAVRALMDANVAIGSDVSVIVWGSMEDSLVGKQVTTIQEPEPKRAGEKMIEMLLSLIEGTPPEELQELWQPELLPGETVGPRIN